MDKLIFIDTNILLDFYRASNDSELKLLDHLVEVSDRLIMTFQVESEFKRNRQKVIYEAIKGLCEPSFTRPAIYSNNAKARKIKEDIDRAQKNIKYLKKSLESAIADPRKDAVCKNVEKLFRKKDELKLGREHLSKRIIRRKAITRFLHGCPPRKSNDTSFGDSFNWEWMIKCCEDRKASLVIVSRDSDYGCILKDQSYVNDHLKQEFKERIGSRQSIRLYSRPGIALKNEFSIRITTKEVDAEKRLRDPIPDLSSTSGVASIAHPKGFRDLIEEFFGVSK